MRAVKGALDDGSFEKETHHNLTLVWFNIREEREEFGKEAFRVLLIFLSKDANLVGDFEFFLHLPQDQLHVPLLLLLLLRDSSRRWVDKTEQ